MLQSHNLFTTISLLSICTSTNTLAQSLSQWERENAVGQHKAFLVIKQPGQGFCYVKQSHANDTTKMKLLFKGNAPVIITPFHRGIAGNVQYWVDDNPKRTVTASKIDMPGSIGLEVDVVAEMKAGQALYVRVKPSGMPERTQRFSLPGFTAAAQALNSPECKEEDDMISSSLWCYAHTKLKLWDCRVREDLDARWDGPYGFAACERWWILCTFQPVAEEAGR